MDGLCILLGEVLVGLVPSLDQCVSQAFSCRHICLLQLKFVGRERWGEVCVVLNVAGNCIGIGRKRISLRLDICRIRSYSNVSTEQKQLLRAGCKTLVTSVVYIYTCVYM